MNAEYDDEYKYDDDEYDNVNDKNDGGDNDGCFDYDKIRDDDDDHEYETPWTDLIDDEKVKSSMGQGEQKLRIHPSQQAFKGDFGQTTVTTTS